VFALETSPLGRYQPLSGVCCREVSVLERCLHWTAVSARETVCLRVMFVVESCLSLRSLPREGHCSRVVSVLERYYVCPKAGSVLA